MRKILLYLTLFNLILLASCFPGAPLNQLPTSMPTKLSNKTITTESPTEQPSPILVTATNLVSNSAKFCPDSRQNLPVNIKGEFVLSGTYTLYRPTLDVHTGTAYILVPVTGEKIIFPVKTNNEMNDFYVSPDKARLVYFSQGSNKDGGWSIASNDGKILKELPEKQYPVGNWQSVLGWFDNNHLLISKFASQPPYSSLLLNTDTGKIEHELFPNYPDIFTGPSKELSTWGRYQLTATVYNSDLSMVVYPKTPNTIVLWNNKAGKEIVEITDRSASSHAPLWLSNGKEFIIDITSKNTYNHWYQDDLMSITIDGKTSRLTNLADLGFTNPAIQNYSESADGRYIAFWFAQIHSGPSRLAIYDTVVKNTKVFCTIVGGYVPPIWAPSDHQLLVDGTFDSLDNYGTIFVDAESGVVSQVKNSVIPVGWLATPK